MLGKKSEEGNICLYYTFIFLNFLVFLQSLALMGIAIYIFIFTESASAFNIGFLIISIVLIGTSLLAFRLRQRLELLAAYLGLLLLVFVGQLILTIMLMVNKQEMLDSLQAYFATNDPESVNSIAELQKKIDRNYDGIIIALWLFTAITFGTLISGFLYRNSSIYETLKKQFKERRETEKFIKKKGSDERDRVLNPNI